MKIKEMQIDDIEKRSLEIEELMKGENADIETLSKEVEELEARKAEILAEVEKRKAEMEEALKNSKEIKDKEESEKRNIMTLKELLESKEYRNAYADYIIKGDDKEVRRLLTENADSTNVGANDSQVPVPTYLADKIQTNWEKDNITSRITKTELKGNLKIGFELSATGATVHAEGADAPTEERLVLGTVEITPETIKKWITVSSEQYDMGGDSFMDYLYSEMAYRIVKEMARIIVDTIATAPAASSATAIGVPSVTEALGATTVLNAEALLGDEVDEIVLIMNRGTSSALKGLMVSSGTNVGDVLDGKTVLETSALDSYASASQGDVFMIVGDLKAVQGNFPNGDEVKFIFDDKSLAERDLVKVVGRLYGGFEIIREGAFVKVIKA